MKKIIFVFILLLSITLICGCEKSTNNGNKTTDDNIENKDNNTLKEDDDMEEFTSKIKLKINDIVFEVTLIDNEASRELVKRLPLNISMNELNGNEKYYYFDKSLPSNPSRPEKINAGDIMLYGSDCLVLFYDTFNTSYSYTKIGKLDNPTNIKNVVGSGNIDIYITK